MSKPRWRAWNRNNKPQPETRKVQPATHNQSTDLAQLVSLVKLIFVDGYRKDESLTLLQDTITIGRDLANDINFPEDTQVSREHARIVQGKESYILEVFGSNGALYNGELQKQAQLPLQHGDHFQIGKTLIRVDVIGTPSPMEQPTSSNQTTWLLPTGLILLALALTLGYLYKTRTTPPPKKRAKTVAVRPLHPKPRKKRQRQLVKLWEQGASLAKQQKWKEALGPLRKASLLAPNNMELQQQLQDIRAEMRTQATLQTVQRLLRAKHVRRCSRYKNTWLALVPLSRSLAVGSVYAETYWKLQFQVWQKMKRYCRRRRRSPIKRPPPPQIAKPTAALLVKPKRKKDGVALYNGGQIELAIAHYKRRKKKKRVQRIKAFVKAYRQGRKAYIQRNSKEGVTLLLRAYTLDRRLGKGRSLYTPQLQQMLATLYYVRGKNALEYNENYANAYSQFVRALRYAPQHKLAKGKLKELENLARRWYKLALRQMKQGNKGVARRLLRRGAQILSPKSPLYQKIRSKLLGK